MPQEHIGFGISSHVDALVARAGVAEAGARHGSGAAPASRRRVSQPADEHVAMCDGFEHGTERGIGCGHREAKCGKRGDCRVGHGAPHANSDDHERVKGSRVWVTCVRDKSSN